MASWWGRRVVVLLLIGAVLLAFWSPAPTSAQTDDDRRVLEQAAAAGRLTPGVASAVLQGRDTRVLVQSSMTGTYRVEPGLSRSAVQSQRAAVEQSQRALLSRLPSGRVAQARQLQTMPFVAVTVNAAELAQLLRSPEAVRVAEDERVRPVADSRLVAAPWQPRLAQSVPFIGAPSVWASGFTGAGQTVAVLDTGVDKSHAFLAGKVVSEACYSFADLPGGETSFCENGGAFQSTAVDSGVPCPNTFDGCDHGTHVAGIAAGKGAGFSGVAKDSTIIAIQVNGADNVGNIGAFTSDIVLGMERVLALRDTFSIAAVNLSMGGTAFTSQSACDASSSVFVAAIANLRAAGIPFVVSSGNNSRSDALLRPACISGAVSVGSTSEAGVVSSFSNSASFLTLLAPGAAITSSVPGGGFAEFDGTSMAAPHVAGAFALLRSRAPNATVDQVQNALISTGVPTLDARNGLVKPRIQVDAAAGAVARFLTVTRTGPGSGSVAGSGIACGSDCAHDYAPGTQVTLTATAQSGSTFSGWGGACAGTGTCVVTLDTDKTVSAAFSASLHELTVAKSGTGAGTVTGLGIDCGSDCSEVHANGTPVTLTASATVGASFAGWSGACASAGTNTTCTLTVTGTTAVVATFRPASAGVGLIAQPPASAGSDRLLVATLTARAGCGGILRLQMGTVGQPFDNARISFNALANGPVNQTSGFIFEPTGSPTSVSFTVGRVIASGSATVRPIRMTDGCGEWQTFVGGGPDAFAP